MATNDQQSFEYELVPQQNSANFYNSENNNGTTTQRSPNRTSTTYVMESGSTSKQYIAAFAGNLVAFTAGICLTWTSPCLLKLYDYYETQSPLDRQITDDEKSWISSLCPLAAAIGPFLAGYLADKIGRKKTLLGSGIPLIVGFVLLATTKTVIQIYVARVLWGLSIGAIFTVLPMYLGEIAQDDIRGALGSMMNLFITFGILWSSAVGCYTDWYVFTYLSMAVPIIFLVLFTFMPESPYYLSAQNSREASVEALMFLRSKSNDGVQKELEQINCIIEESKQQSGTFLDLFKTTARRKGMMLSCGLVGFQQLSGINAVLFFAGPIFLAAGQDDVAMSSVILGVVQVISSGVTPLVVDRLGRRILLLISGIGMCIGLICLGWYFNLQKTQDVSAIKMMPVISLIVYMIVYCIGFGPLPWAVMGEVFSNNVKSSASTLTASFCWLLGFFITKYFESIKDQIGSDITFWFFAVMCVVATIFVYFLLPETKGKSLEEIQMILENRQK